MGEKTAMSIAGCRLYFIDVPMRVPLKFGAQTLTSVTCARVHVSVRDQHGRESTGWGETPLSVAWVWPSDLDYGMRHERLKNFCETLTTEVAAFPTSGHALEIGHAFIDQRLPDLAAIESSGLPANAALPYLAALVCFSAFDLAIHDAFGNLVEKPVYETYTPEFLGDDLASYLTPEEGSGISFSGRFPADFLAPRQNELPVWHLVGGLDAISASGLTGDEPDDGYPVLLRDWIRRDGLDCLKIKLRGNDSAWDTDRLVAIGEIAQEEGVSHLTADFNCTVTDPAYVTDILDFLVEHHPETHRRLLYVEQPFPYDLHAQQIDVSSVSSRKPLYLDESAHDWTHVAFGKRLGWNGVALKTCKTQTGALLSLCWARAHGMGIMVQDLTNPMLAQIPHVLLAAHADTIMGVESNGMQFYPEASKPYQAVHPGVYRRENGLLRLGTLAGSGFGYAMEGLVKPASPPAIASRYFARNEY